MSRFYGNYSQYLGAQRCCDIRVQGPQGPIGLPGPASIGPMGYTGSVGATGPTGKGCRGPTGPQGEGGKPFIIEHPNDNNKYLVHTCLEGPEAGVYYRGRAHITNNFSTAIQLPEYVENLAYDFTIQVTPIYNGKIITLNVSEVTDNKFMVYGENCSFYWNLIGKRFDIEVEPYKNDVVVKGSGPYKWI